MMNYYTATLVFILHSEHWFSISDLRAVAVLAVFGLLFAFEALGGCRNIPRKTTRQSYLSNLGTFIVNDTLMSLLSVSALFVWAGKFGHLGLLHGVEDAALKAGLAFLLLDLSLYVWHRLNHSHDWLWMFHKVHHSDQAMNVTTAFRLHFVELALTALVKALFILVIGVKPAVVLANEVLVTVLVMLHHANIRLPWEHWLAKLIVVPSLHRVHHSILRKEHDNNYGFVFSFWDRLFGSFAEQEPVKIGLESIPAMGVFELIRYGLSGRWVPQPKVEFQDSRLVDTMIAEAAYYRSKARGFAPGYDYNDWLEAEREILSRVKQEKRGKRRPSFTLGCR